MPATPSLIITLTLDKTSQEYFTKLRTENFPAYCNYVDAHLTLFHRLPADLPLMDDVLKKSSIKNVMNLLVTDVVNTGSNVAFACVSNELMELHRELQSAFNPYLISRDKNEIWPHITIQNKVTLYKARQTKERLIKTFQPFSIQGTGLSVWKYMHGPWEHVSDYRFL